MVSVYLKLTEEGSNGSQEVRKLLLEALRRQYPHLQSIWAGGLPAMEKNAFGKPYFADYPEIYFNLSHTKGCVCCALGNAPVGVDVEMCRRRANQERIVKRFSSEEQQLWKETAKGQRQELFFALWVLKESCVKADGRGLRIPLDAFSVRPGEGPVFPYGEWTAQVKSPEESQSEQRENGLKQKGIFYHLNLYSPLDILDVRSERQEETFLFREQTEAEKFPYRIAVCCEKTGFLGPFLVE